MPPELALTADLHAADPVLFAQDRLAFAPDPAQAALLRAPAHRVLLNCSRQWGKSTVTSVAAVHRAVTRPHSLVLVVSPSERQSREFLRKAAHHVRRLGLPVRRDPGHPVSLALPNDSRLIGLPANEDTVRGFSAASLLLVDEASRVPDALAHAVLPSLAASDGDLWLLSTPNGRQGAFWRAWSSGEPWHRVQVPASECPRIRPAFLAGERRRLPDWRYRQEYECAFTDTDEQLFPTHLIDAAVDAALPALHGQEGWVVPGPTDFSAPAYWVGLDLGQGRDRSALCVVERVEVAHGPYDWARRGQPTAHALRLRHLERLPLGTPYPDVVEAACALVGRLLVAGPFASGRVTLALDATGVGAPVADLLRRRCPRRARLEPVTITGGGQAHAHRDGHAVPARDLAQGLLLLLQSGQLRLSGALPELALLRSELAQFRRHLTAAGHDRYEAARGHDDLVFSVALAAWHAAQDSAYLPPLRPAYPPVS